MFFDFILLLTVVLIESIINGIKMVSRKYQIILKSFLVLLLLLFEL